MQCLACAFVLLVALSMTGASEVNKNVLTAGSLLGQMGNLKAAVRSQIVSYVANQLKGVHGGDSICPEGFTPEMCKQPATFYVWLRELREQMVRKEIERHAKIALFQLFSKVTKQHQANYNKLTPTTNNSEAAPPLNAVPKALAENAMN